MEAEGDALTAAGLARLAGVPEAEIGRMVEAGVLVPRDGRAPFLLRDLHKLRLAVACERAGLPMDGIAAAIRAGRLSFAFMEASPYARWAVPSGRTYRQVSAEAGVPLDDLRAALEAMGFAWLSPDEPMREDELEVVPLVRLAFSSGIFDRALMGIYRRQQELIWVEHQVLNVEAALEEAGAIARPERLPAMCFLDLAGYTRLTEERGDQAAAELAGTLAVLVERSSRAHGGTPVKWLGDGVMLHFREPSGAVEAAMAMVVQVPQAGLPPAHVGVAAGPVVVQGGDYFGRTVNLAARIAARATAGQVLVSQSVAESAPYQGVTFVEVEGAPAQGVRPSGAGAGGRPRVTTDASASSRRGPAEYSIAS